MLFILNVEIPSIEMIEIVKSAGHEFFTNILKLLITEAWLRNYWLRNYFGK